MASEGPRRVAILTSGGDAPGMNAVVRAAVRAALEKGLDDLRGRGGLPGARRRRASGSAGWAGTTSAASSRRGAPSSARRGAPAFRTREGRLAAARNVARERIDALIVVGGDGSLTGADLFRREWPGLLKELASARGELPPEIGEGPPRPSPSSASSGRSTTTWPAPT